MGRVFAPSSIRWGAPPTKEAWLAWRDAATWRCTGGPAAAFPAEVLADLKKSMFLSRPALMDYCATREELEWRAGEVFGWVASGELKVRIGGTYPLSDAAEAHRRLEGRETTGKLLLIP